MVVDSSIQDTEQSVDKFLKSMKVFVFFSLHHLPQSTFISWSYC